jgi:acetyl-CoA acetyltransferase
MTKFAKHKDKTLKDLARMASWDAIKDAGVDPKAIQMGYVANAAGGVITGQTMVAGQVMLREVGIVGIPIINVENACASGSTALLEAYHAIRNGRCDIAIALGVEKLYANDTMVTTAALAGAGDVELEMSNGVNFPTHWALRAAKRMEICGTTREQFAIVCQEPQKRLLQPPCAISEGMHGRRSAQFKNDRRSHDFSAMFTDRGRRRSSDFVRERRRQKIYDQIHHACGLRFRDRQIRRAP